MSSRRRHCSAIAALSCLAACAVLPGRSDPAAERTARRLELLRAQEDAAERAARGNVVDAIVGTIDATGFYVPAIREFGVGPEAARRFLARDTSYAGARASWRVLRWDVSADGNDGYTYGYFDLIRSPGDTQPGWFVAYWRRSPSGAWKTLALRRQRREAGRTEPLPDSARPPANAYRAWGVDSVSGWRSLAATEDAFSDSSKHDVAAAFAAFAAPDAAKVDRARFDFGPVAIGAAFRPAPAFFSGIEWHAQYGTVGRSGDLGFDVGPVMRKSDTGTQFAGLFFTIWKRQSDGSWRYLVD